MIKREHFTAGRVAKFACQPEKQQSIYWDGKTPGLGLRVTAAGAKSYIFETSLNNKTMRVTIGNVRTWAIDEAQAEATRLKALTDKGIDPRQQKSELAAATIAKLADAQHAKIIALEAWKIYIAARTPRWSSRSLLDHKRLSDAGGKPKNRGRKKGEGATTLPGLLRPLLLMPLAEIDADHVRVWLKDEASRRPTQAMNGFVRLRAFMNWCADRPEYRTHAHADACAARIARDELPKKAAKDDCLQREQLPLWFEHVKKLSNPVHSAYLQSLLLTGARREELAGLGWHDVDFQWKTITIKDKIEGTRTIPLTPYVTSLLRSLKARNETPPQRPKKMNIGANEKPVEWHPSPWVFSSPLAASGRLMEPRTGHNKALAAAGLPALSLHGLRRSFGTLAEWVECPAGVSAQIMGHKPSAIAEKHYRRRPIDLLRSWHVKIEAWILREADVSVTAVDDTNLPQLVKSS